MPEKGRSPIELLTNGSEFKKPYYSDKIIAFMGGAFGLGLAFYLNWGQRKPLLSGLQKHIALTAVGFISGHIAEKWRNDYYAEKDAVLRHYIELHPDAFPSEERKKYKEVMIPWIPIR